MGQFLISFTAALITIFLMSAVLRGIAGGFIGSSKIRNKKIIRIMVAVVTGFYMLTGIFYKNTLSEKIIFAVPTLLAGIIVYCIFRYSDFKELRKNTKKEENKYMWENIRDSL